MPEKTRLHEIAKTAWRAVTTKQFLYAGVELMWAVLAAGIVVAVGMAFGNHSNGFAVVAGWFLLIYVGRVAIDVHVTRAWRTAGRRANLKAADGNRLFGKPVMTGHLNGCTIRARLVHRSILLPLGFPGPTVVEADLNRPVDEGFVLTSTDRSWKYTDEVRDLPAESADARDNQFAVYGHGHPAERAVLSGRTRDDLLATKVVGLEVFIGDASDAIATRYPVPKVLKGLWIRMHLPSVSYDPSTVVIKRPGMALESDEIRRYAEAVAAVTAAVEKQPRPGRNKSRPY